MSPRQEQLLHDNLKRFEPITRALWTAAVGLTAVAIAVLLLWPFLAHAQAAAPAADPAELASMLQALFTAVVNGQAWIAVGIGISILVWVVRVGALKLLPKKVADFLHQPMVSFSLPFVLALLGGLGTALAGGSPFTVMLLLTEVLKVGGMALTSFMAVKNVAEQRQLAVAKAEAVVPDKRTALDVLRRGPNP